MEYEFDPFKAAGNIVKHGIAFEAALDFDWETALIRADVRRAYPEPRYFALGLLNGRLHAMAFCLRQGAVRVISLRKANDREVNSDEYA
jgi:uncharacterized DUF497 family protein